MQQPPTMTTPAAAAFPPTMASFKPVMPPDQPPGAAAHGADNTIKIQRHTTPIKIEFVVSSTQNTFNLVKAHKEVLKLLKGKYPTLEIIPSKAGKTSFKEIV